MADEPVDISLEEYNNRIKKWGSETGVKLRDSIRMLTTKGKGALVKSVRLRTGQMSGEIDKLSYYFARHGVFVHKGVGRGYALINGTVVRVSGKEQTQFLKRYVKRGGQVDIATLNKTNERISGISSTINRKPVLWFNPVITDNIDELADMVTEMNADRAVRATGILIK